MHIPKKEMLLNALYAEQTQFFLLTPLCLGFGIYAHTLWHTPFQAGVGAVLMAGLYFLGKRYRNSYLALVSAGAFWLCLGSFIMGYKAPQAFIPEIKVPSEKPLWIKGRVENISRSQKEKRFQIHIDRLEGYKNAPPKLLLNYKFKTEKVFREGDILRLKAMIFPLKRPFLPNGCDYTKQRLYKGIGGEGYVTYIHSIQKKRGSVIGALREHVTDHILKTFPGQTGAVIAALITGDTTSITPKTRQQFVDTGIAHILAISGLHLSLVGAVFFFFFRVVGGAVPFVYRYIPAQKLAAILSLGGAFLYLVLSGGRIPTVRAFIAFSCIMGGILLNRPTLSLRVVAIAALITLMLFPESLGTPSFQLSFAAVTALISAYEFLTPRLPSLIKNNRFLYYICSLFVSSLIASIATFPFVVYHFGKTGAYTLVTNCVMVPLLGTLLLPLLMLWLFLSFAPGVAHYLEHLISYLFKLCFFMLDHINSWPGNIIYIPPIKDCYFIVSVLGLILFCILKSKLRLLGACVFGIGLGLMLHDPAPKPWIFISDHGRIVGLYQKPYFFISQRRRKTFLSDVWGTHVGVPQENRYRFVDRNHVVENYIQVHNKNYLILSQGQKIWIENEEAAPPQPVHTWISRVRENAPNPKPQTFMGKNNLRQTIFIYADGKILSR